jgi:hypothetical protein
MNSKPQSERSFLETLTLLMRLTRDGRMDWQEVSQPLPLSHSQSQDVYEAELEDMKFHLEHMPAAFIGNTLPRGAHSQYRLVVEDPSNDAPIKSPPMKAAKDLAAVIRKADERRRGDLKRRLEEVNKRLKAVS